MRSVLLILFVFCSFLASCQTESGIRESELSSNANFSMPTSENASHNDGLMPSPSTTIIAKRPNDIELKVGIVQVNNDAIICLRTQNQFLPAKSEVLIVGWPNQIPQKIVKAFVAKKLSNSCVSDDTDAGDSQEDRDKTAYYELKLVAGGDAFDSIGVGIAVFDISNPIKVSNGHVNIDLNNDGQNEFFRSCASSEGLHLTVWSGKPLIGKRLWHRYYYLRYDTEPSCKEKDYEGTDE